MILHLALSKGGYEAGEDYQIRGEFGVDAWDNVLEWLHSDPRPSEAQVNTWWGQVQAEQSAASLLQVEKGAIKTLALEASQHAGKIKLIFSAVVIADRQAENTDVRFVRICDALNDPSIPNAFRTLVMTAFTAETGLSFSFANVPAVIVTTRQAFNSFARRFSMTWALMLMVNT